jgi:hypothetical protein
MTNCLTTAIRTRQSQRRCSPTVGVITPNSGAEDAGTAGGGQAYPLAYYYQFDEVGNPATSFQVPNHPTTYDVNWGDGASGTYYSETFNHTYAYDTSPTTPTNFYAYTLTAHNAEYTYGWSNFVNVVPSMAGNLTVTGPGSGIEGTYVTASATFSDPAQGSTRSLEGADSVYVFWGDGSEDVVTPDSGDPPLLTAGFSHIYAEPGSYEATFFAGYNENGTESAIYDMESASIDQFMPTLTTSESTASPAVGHSVTVYGTYNDTVGDHRPQTWTVSWGDGTTSVRDNDTATTESFAHAYATAGTYDPIVSVAAFALTGSASGTASAIAVHNPTLSIAGGSGTATEFNQVPDYFTISRSEGDAFPLTVSYTLGGTAATNTLEYIVTDDATGKILTGTATIPAGSLYEIVDITPLEDNTPRWTDSLDMTLTSSANYSLGTSATIAQTGIDNCDLSLYLGDGSENIILGSDAGGDSNLIPLTFKFPTEGRDGAEVSISMPSTEDGVVDVWATPTPGSGDTPVLGYVSGAYVDSHTWTYGSGTNEPPSSGILYVAYQAASASMTVDWAGYDSDANATPVSPAPPTTNSATSQPAAAVGATVTFSKSEVRPGTAANRAEAVDVTATRAPGSPIDTEETVKLSVVNKGGGTDGAATIDVTSVTIPANKKSATATIHVRGTHLSGAAQDVSVIAGENGKAAATLPVTVVAPTKWTDDALGGVVSAANVATVVGPLRVHWQVPVVFTVEDQFGTPLDSTWQGAGLAEHVIGGGQGFSGFTVGSASTAISASATATDPVQYLSGNFANAATANGVAAGTIGIGPAKVLNRTLEYKVIDADGTAYTLEGQNKRVVTIHDRDVMDSDTQQ